VVKKKIRILEYLQYRVYIRRISTKNTFSLMNMKLLAFEGLANRQKVLELMTGVFIKEKN